MEEIFFTTTAPLKGRIKQRYSDFIVEEVTPDGKRCEVRRYNKPFEDRVFENFAVPKNPEGKEHLIVEMEKVNYDTVTALRILSRGLNVSQKRFGYAGLKDKRAITCQRLSMYQPEAARVEKFGVKGIEIRRAEWSDKRIELGDLKGNQFTITIRDITEGEEEIKKILEGFATEAQKGLPNFFGMQRFGGKRKITHRAGKLLLARKFEEAIMLYLTETYEEEKIELKQARINLAKTLDFAKALKEFPAEDARSEKAILNHLVKNPKDFSGAFGVLPKKIRYLFTHAYQSHIFNEVLAERIKLLGENALKAQEGDELVDGKPTGLLPGYESKFSGGIQGEIEKRVMEKEGVTFANFKTEGMGELSSQGSRKEIIVAPENFIIGKIGLDEFNEGKRFATVSFFLGKGNYATTIIRELIKEEMF